MVCLAVHLALRAVENRLVRYDADHWALRAREDRLVRDGDFHLV